MDKILYDTDCKNMNDNILLNALNRYYLTKEFKELLSYLSKNIGYGDSYVNFYFWDSLDEYEKTFYEERFDGVEVDYLGDVSRYNLETLYYYANVATQRYIDVYPEDKDEMSKIMERMRKNYLL